jgi:dienelactone hydrolase
VWTPEGVTGARPLVLVGHGGGLHKRADYVLGLARRLVRHQQMAVVAIDGPFHGDRPEAGEIDLAAATSQRRLAFWSDDAANNMIADWQSTTDQVQRLPEIGDGPLGYWGLSMGTIFGVPYVASEPRVRVAVLGLMGLIAPLDTRLAADAAYINCPVLFLQQLDDELISANAAVELFRAIASTDKRLHAHPGAHSAVPVEEIEASESFLARHLRTP